MALDIDGFAVLRSIGAHHGTFPDIAADASKAARALVIKQIKAKNVQLKSIQGVRKAIGADSFNLILDGMPDAQIKTLVGRLDKSHPELKTSSPQWRREHVRALVAGSVEPTVKSPSPPKRKKGGKVSSEQAGTPELISYRSAGAKRKR
jgi:hypothetical protein